MIKMKEEKEEKDKIKISKKDYIYFGLVILLLLTSLISVRTFIFSIF